jgi:hypothetical protein
MRAFASRQANRFLGKPAFGVHDYMIGAGFLSLYISVHWP